MKKHILGLTLLTSLTSFASDAIKCTSDFSIMEVGILEIEIKNSEQEKLQFFLNGALANPDVKVIDFPIREGIKFTNDFYIEGYASYNFGEQALNGIFVQDNGLPSPEAGEPDYVFPTGISFDLSKVRQVKIYDLTAKNDSLTDKFGGTILIEAFDENQELLGRAARALLTMGCN